MADIKKRRITKKDWDEVQKYILKELENREKSTFRRTHEQIWREVDRQVRMDTMVRTARNPNEREADWHNVVELGELAKASEVLSADVRRIVFPTSRAWFEVHAELPTTLDEMGNEQPPDQKLQKYIDGAMRALMVQQHQDFGFKARFDLSVKEALHHGSFVAEIIFETDTRVHNGTGIETVGAPVWIPHSMWNCYPDPSVSVINANMFYGGSMIIKSYQPRYKLMDMVKGDGWMQSQLDKIPKRTNKNKDENTDDVEIVTYYGDIEIKRQDGTILLLNNKVMLANGIIVYRWENELPYPPIIYAGYERIDVRDPYFISPIIKLSPMQKLASQMANKFLDAVDLKNEPPIVFDASDPQFARDGGPRIYPGAKNGTKGSAEYKVIETGDPMWALQGLQLGLQQLQSGTAVDAARAGGPEAGIEKTATEIRRTAQSGEIRTIDFVDKIENQGIRTYLYFQHELNKRHLENYAFYNPEMDAPDFMRWSRRDLPKSVQFEIVGSKGLLGEEDRINRTSQVTAFLLSNPLTAPLVNIVEVAKQGYQDAGNKNPERFLNIPDNGVDPQVQQIMQQMEQMQQQAQQMITDLQEKMERLEARDIEHGIEKQQWKLEQQGFQQQINDLQREIKMVNREAAIERELQNIKHQQELANQNKADE